MKDRGQQVIRSMKRFGSVSSTGQLISAFRRVLAGLLTSFMLIPLPAGSSVLRSGEERLVAGPRKNIAPSQNPDVLIPDFDFSTRPVAAHPVVCSTAFHYFFDTSAAVVLFLNARCNGYKRSFW